MVFSRKDAIILVSFLKILNYNNALYNELIETSLAETNNESENFSDTQKNSLARKYLIYQLSETKNSYLIHVIKKMLNKEVTIVGKEPKLFACNCCHYKTLRVKSEYFICPVCFWEDDGINQDDAYSVPNDMKLGEARKQFSLNKSCDVKYLQYLNEDRFLMYGK
jgi:hypothetical protein